MSPVGDGNRQILGTNLAQTPLASVLITALKQKVTGELTIRHALGEDGLYFQSGVPTGTQVMRAFKPLGRLLLELGWIDMPAMEKSVELMAQGRRQGEALVEIGAIDNDQLERGLRLLQIRNLVEVAKLTKGDLEFEASRPPPAWAAGVPPNALRSLREVLIAPPSAPIVDRLIERIGGERTPVRIPEHLEPSLEHFDLEDDEYAAACRLLELGTLTAFWEHCGLAPVRAHALAAELALTGMLVTYGVAEDTNQLAGKPGSSSRQTAEQARQQLNELMRGTPQAPVARRHRPIEDDRARRRRLVQRAIASSAVGRLSDALAGKGKPAEAAAPAAPQAQPATPTDGRPLNDEERAFEALVLERIALLPTQDLFDRLGVPRSATLQQIKSAFVKAAQLYHPDHLPPKLAHLAVRQREIFSSVKEAYDVLADDTKRREYLASKERRPAARAGGNRDEDAKIAAFRGEALLQKCDYGAAAEAFHAAYQLSQNGDHLASELWCVIADPSRKLEVEETRRKLIDTAARHPEAARPSYYLGVLAKSQGRMDEADQLFRNVLRINPKHMEAGQELRLLELRKKRGGGPKR